MKRVFFILFCLASASKALAAGWTDVGNGLSYQKMTIASGGSETALHAFKFKTTELSIRPVYEKSSSTARRMAKRAEALLVVNANFFDADNEPLGLVVANGKTLHSAKDISWWAVFCVKNRGAAIVPPRAYRDGICDEAVQAGPRLVVNGTVPKLKDESSRKTAVGLTRAGEAVFVVSEGSVRIVDLAETFKKPEAQGGLGCPNALNLDGGSSSQLHAKSGKFTLDVPSFVRVPVGLGVFLR
jgi:uncharacterized protein YigE (DUF2233 family)